MDLKTELNEETEADESGWEHEPTTLGEGELPPPCNTIGKRHKWRGGNVCIVCGVAKEAAQPTGEKRPRASKSAQGLPEMLSLGWSFAGMAIAARSDRLVPVGNVMQAQSPIAGPHLDNILRRTPIYKLLTSTGGGIMADVIPLAMPPILVGLATRNERTARAMRPMVIALMLPVLIEAAQRQQSSNQLLEELNSLTSEQLDRATRMVDELLGLTNEGA